MSGIPFFFQKTLIFLMSIPYIHIGGGEKQKEDIK